MSFEVHPRHAPHEAAHERAGEAIGESLAAAGSFSSQGSLPPAGASFADPSPSASERAFDHVDHAPATHGHGGPKMEMVTEGSEFYGATSVTGADGQTEVVATDQQKAGFAGAAKAGFTTLRYFIDIGMYGTWGEGGAEGGPNYVTNQIRDISDDIIAARQLGYHFQYQVVLKPTHNTTATQNVPTVHDPHKFAQYVSQVVGALSKLGVHRFSMGNEPNLAIYNNPDPKHYSLERAARSYRNLYDAGYAAAHRADPHAQVLFGELAGGFRNAVTFLEDVIKAKKQPILAEGFALHPYQNQSLPTQRPPHGELGIGNLDEMDRLLAKFRDHLHTPDGKELPLFLSEFGYFRQPSGHTPAWPETPGTGHMTRQRAMLIALNNALKHHVREITQFEFFHGPDGSTWDTGIASQDANGNAVLDATGQAEETWIHDHRHSVL